MTNEEAEKLLAEVVKYANDRDHEGAHIERDNLYRDVLRAIAAGADNARELAAIALRSEDVEFSRWYA